MAAVWAVSVLIDKLETMRAGKEIFYPHLNNNIIRALKKLRYFRARLLIEADKKQRIDPTTVALLRAVYSAEDLIDSFLIRRELQKQSFLLMRPLIDMGSVWNQLILSFKMENFLRELPRLYSNLEDIRDQELEMKEFGAGDDESHRRGGERISDYMDDETEIVGFAREQRRLMAELIFLDERQVIAVAGEGGSGKTTLVRLIYNRIDTRQRFVCRAWLNVGDRNETRDLLIDIFNQVTGVKEADRLSLEELQQRVKEILKEKRYLIVLDDVSTQVWEQLRHVFPESENGSRVVLSGRPETMIKISPAIFIWLNPLTIDESWTLFLKKARMPEDSLNNPRLIKKLKKIVSNCGGLPLIIDTLGPALSNKNLEQLSKLTRLLTHDDGNIGSLTISDLLFLSYGDLPSHLKPCFLYFGLFPKEFEVPVRRLFRLWLAEGLVAAPTSQQAIAPEDLVEEYFEQLVRRNMIAVKKWRSDGSPKTCSMHNLMHEVFFPKAVDTGLFHILRHTPGGAAPKPPQFNVRRLAENSYIVDYSSSSSVLNFQHLRSYVSFNTRKRDAPAKEVDKLIGIIVGKRGFGLLRVLDLEGVYKPVLSETLGRLLHLRYLGLRWTFLDLIPDAVGNLPRLETLDVKHTNISTLPTSIWKVKSLKHLYMNEIHFNMSVHKPSEGGYLTNLQTLWGLFIGDNSPIINGLNKITGLRMLGLTCHSSSLEAISDWISQLPNLQSLRLRSIDKFGQPSELKLNNMAEQHKLSDLFMLGMLPKPISATELPQNLKILTLAVSRLKEDPLPVLGKLPRLSILRLFAQSYLGKSMSCSKGAFPQIRVMKLWMLEELELWSIGEGAMARMRELEIRCCRKLRKAEGLQRLTALKELILTNMAEDFVKTVKGSMGMDVFITVNNWEFSPLPGT